MGYLDVLSGTVVQEDTWVAKNFWGWMWRALVEECRWPLVRRASAVQMLLFESKLGVQQNCGKIDWLVVSDMFTLFNHIWIYLRDDDSQWPVGGFIKMHHSSFCRKNEDTTSRRDVNGMMVSTGKFKHRKPVGELGCCESGMAERSHWWTGRCLISLTLSLSFSDYLPTYLSIFYVSIYLSIFLV